MALAIHPLVLDKNITFTEFSALVDYGLSRY